MLQKKIDTHWKGKKLHLEEKEKMAKKEELTAEEMLLQEIDKKEQELASLRKEIKNLERYKQYEDAADEIKAMHTAFMNSGFDDEKAFTLVNNIVMGMAPIIMKAKLFGKV